MNKLRTKDIELVQTCGACPEQYNAFIKDFFSDNGLRQVGYLRLRHGYFTVEYPWPGGKIIFEDNPDGDGCFTEREREDYLEKAKLAIIDKLNEEQSKAEYWKKKESTLDPDRHWKD